MRSALWLIGLFGIAVAIALFAGSNPGTITVFWPPYRVDLSLNLVLVLLFAAFLLVHLALRALAALFALPGEAQRWRAQEKERALHAAFLGGLSHLTAGRFVRAAKAFDSVLAQAPAHGRAADALPHAALLRSQSHLLRAEAAHALQDRRACDEQLALALAAAPGAAAKSAREGAHLRAARWALDEHDADTALRRLDQLPPAAARRILARRLRLAAAAQAGRRHDALACAQGLGRHGALPAVAAQDVLRGLALELIRQASDAAELQRTWSQLGPAERENPRVAIRAAERLQRLGGDTASARQWLVPAWEQMVAADNDWPETERVRLASALVPAAGSAAAGRPLEADWRARIDAARQRNPDDPLLQYLAGTACLRDQNWSAAQPLLASAAGGLHDTGLRRNSWRALAQLAERRGDAGAAAEALRRAAQD